MSSFLHRGRWLFEPALAVVFFVFWAIDLVGRHQLGPGMLRSTVPFWAALLLLAVAIGVSHLQPILAMALGTAVLLGQLLFSSAIFEEPLVYLGYAIVIVVVAARVHGRMRVGALVFAIGSGVSAAGLLAWAFGVGRGDPGARAMLFVLCAFAAVIAWLIGTLIGVWSRNRCGVSSVRFQDARRCRIVSVKRWQVSTSPRRGVRTDEPTMAVVVDQGRPVSERADGGRLGQFPPVITSGCGVPRPLSDEPC